MSRGRARHHRDRPHDARRVRGQDPFRSAFRRTGRGGHGGQAGAHPPQHVAVAVGVRCRLVSDPVRRARRRLFPGARTDSPAHPGGVLMPLARAWSVALIGVDGRPVEIEADIGAGLPGTKLVGLPDPGLREAKDRVRAAVRNSGQSWPDSNITLGLSPANLPKDGSGYDLGIAAAVLAASGAVPAHKLLDTVLVGELALDGRVRPVRGVLPALLAARRVGYRRAGVAVASLSAGAVA